MNKPKVGIFWFDAKTDKLFGVAKVDAASLPFDSDGHKTIEIGHGLQWETLGRSGNYEKIPRGRIYEIQGNGFCVITGRWINDYPQVKKLIAEEFDLQNSTTTYMYDSRWDIDIGQNYKPLRSVAEYLNKRLKTDAFKWFDNIRPNFLGYKIKGDLEFSFDGLNSFTNLHVETSVCFSIDENNDAFIEIALEAWPVDEENYDLSEFAESWHKLYDAWYKYVSERINEAVGILEPLHATFHEHYQDTNEDIEQEISMVGYMNHVYFSCHLPFNMQKEIIADFLIYLHNCLK